MNQQQQSKPRYPYGDMRNSYREPKRAGHWYYDADGQLRQIRESVN